MNIDVWYDWFMKSCVLQLYSKLDQDCLYQILQKFPHRVWARCNGCGMPLIRRCENGQTHVTTYCNYSYEWCDVCYNAYSE